jgi:hypothetical protein
MEIPTPDPSPDAGVTYAGLRQRGGPPVSLRRQATSFEIPIRARVILTQGGLPMYRRETIVLLIFILAAIPLVAAQTSAPNTNTGESIVTPSQEVTKPPIRANPQAGQDADARICLEFSTNAEIRMCAEKYRRHKRNS